MNILITGISGFFGKNILSTLNAENKVSGLSRKNSTYNFDLSTEVPLFKDYFELVIHAAGKAHLMSGYPSVDVSFYETNVVGTENLLKGLENTGVLPKYFVFISSVSVYGMDSGTNISETSFLGAKDPYGLSKIKAELLILRWCKENDVVCTILRLPLIVGNEPKGNLYSMIRGIKSGYYFNVSGGRARKSMVLVNDVIDIILRSPDKGGIYNLTDGYHPSFLELSTAIARKLGKYKVWSFPFFLVKIIAIVGDVVGSRFPLNSVKLKKMTTDLTFDDSRARQVLGWNPKRVLDYYV